MSSDTPNPTRQRRINRRGPRDYAGRYGAYDALDIDPEAFGVRECEHPDCSEDEDLQLVERLEGDFFVYCPEHRDNNWGVKIR